jgi:hypothetical protein
MNRSSFRAPALAAVALSACAIAARAEVTSCTAITAIPTTITSPGIYCLTGDLSLDGTGTAVAITVDGPEGVVIDLNGYTIDGGGGGTGLVVRNAKRVTLRNGSLVGLARAAQIPYTGQWTQLEDLKILAVGLNPTIESHGWGTVIQRNWIERGKPVIRTYGPATRITNNDITFATDGIDIEGYAATVEDNRVSRHSASAGSFGIRTSSGHAILSRNTVSAFAICFDMGANTRYRENVTNVCTYTYTGGIGAGGNF